MLTHAELYQILLEADARVADERWPTEVRTNSAETVSLVIERLQMEPFTVDQLRALAKPNSTIRHDLP